MKVLIVGKSENFNLEYYIKRALESITVETRFIGYESFVPTYFSSFKLLTSRSYSFRELASSTYLRKYNNTIVNELENFTPDLVLIIKGDGLGQTTLRKISREYGCKTALWFPDDPRFFNPLSSRIGKEVDFVLTSSENAISLYREAGISSVYRIPFGFDPEIHRTLEIPRTYDISFIGTAGKRRMRIIRELIKNGIKVDVFGKGWQMIPNSLRHNPVFGYDYVRIINQSVLNLNVHQNIEYGPNMRSFEVTGSGSVLITDKAEDIESFFGTGQILFYEDAFDLIRVIKELHRSDQNLEYIRESVLKHSLKNHGYSERARTIKSIMHR